MLKTTALAVLCCAATAHATVPSEPRNPDVIGQAFEQQNGALVYSEHHYCNVDKSLCQVEYLDADGAVIASKDLIYEGNPSAPGVHLRDYRTDTEFALAPSPDPELVVDAGFDNYVRQRWTALVEGEPVRFPFLVAGRDSPLAMRAEPGSRSDCLPGEVCLQIELDSWLLGMLVDPIELTYDRESRRLLRFKGISNLTDASGNSQSVDIRYHYPDIAPR